MLRELAEFLELPEPPQRIEVYDNSHIQGTNALGAMIVAGPEGFIKNQYRKWNIKTAQTNDDFRDDARSDGAALRARAGRGPGPRGGNGNLGPIWC
jgi:excinuclease UvrABC nuclease subunit